MKELFDKSKFKKELKTIIEKFKNDSEMKGFDIDVVELNGGFGRCKLIKDFVKHIFSSKDIFINQLFDDKSISIGCCLIGKDILNNNKSKIYEIMNNEKYILKVNGKETKIEQFSNDGVFCLYYNDEIRSIEIYYTSINYLILKIKDLEKVE